MDPKFFPCWAIIKQEMLSLIHFSLLAYSYTQRAIFLAIIKLFNFYFVLPRQVCDPPLDLRPTHSSPQKTVGFFLFEFNPSIPRHGGI
jgi:hypothetical protein